MEYRILGPLEVIGDGESIDIGSRQQRGLLALLLLNANRTVSTERILEDLWGDDPIGKERTLWVYISRLRAILEPDREAHAKASVLVTRDRGYSLVVDRADIDAQRFEELAQIGSGVVRDDPEQAIGLLDEALSLWRGAALDDFQFDEWAQPDVARLAELRIVALEDRIDACIRAGRHRDVIGELEQLTRQHPHRERLVGLQMVALYRSGRQADALRAFERHRRQIDDELGIVPSPELRRIEEQVLLHDQRLAPAVERIAVVEQQPGSNPFKGLEAFEEADAAAFFGRERLVGELIRRVGAGARLLALVGASGSGKSSVLRAGLVAAVRKGAVPGSGGWVVVQMVPGSRPFRELEVALLRSSLDAPDGLAELLDDPEDGMLRACLRMVPDPPGRLLLVIDQFEELFTLASTTEERDRFVRNLEVVLDDVHGRVVVAIGLRADFYGRPLEYPHFAQLLGDGIVNVAPMSPDELEAAAEQPAEQAGATLEPALVVQLLGDVAGQVGGLPLFQYALTELFERRRSSVLTLEAYHEMGGVSGALARRAEDLFLGFDDEQRHAAKQLFLRLVSIVDQGGWGRRRVTGAEIASIAADLVALQSSLSQFGAHRLLTFDRDRVTGSPTVEVAHEALLLEWPRLRRWIDEGRRDVVRHAHLRTALAEWIGSGEKADYLLSGERLADYAEWAAVSSLRLGRDEERFLDASIMHREQQTIAEEQRHAREVKLEGQARTRLWGLGIGAVLIVAATIGGYFALSEGGQPAIALVHGVAGDSGINDMMISGVGIAEGRHDIEVELEPPLIDPEEHLRQLAEAGTDLLIVGSEFDLAVERLAASYPEVHWVAIDPVAIHSTGSNLTEMHFAVEDSAFVAGAAAALTSVSGRVGFVGGVQSFRTEASRNGFEQGAIAERSDIEVVSTFIGPVVDPLAQAERSAELAHELATEMYASGVDVVFHDAGAAGRGVVRAAVEWSDDRSHVWAIGSDADEYYTVPPSDRHVVLTSTIKRFDTAVESAIDAFLDGSLQPGENTLGFVDEGVAVSPSGGHIGPAIAARLRNLEGDVSFGHVTVSPHATRPPQWQLDADVVVALVVEDGDCAIRHIDGAVLDGEILPVDRGDIVRFEIDNRSPELGGFSIRTVPVDMSIDEVRAEMAPGAPSTLGSLLGITVAQLGAGTSTAVRVEGTPVVPNCIRGDPALPTEQHIPLIVRPT